MNENSYDLIFDGIRKKLEQTDNGQTMRVLKNVEQFEMLFEAFRKTGLVKTEDAFSLPYSDLPVLK